MLSSYNLRSPTFSHNRTKKTDHPSGRRTSEQALRIPLCHHKQSHSREDGLCDCGIPTVW